MAARVIPQRQGPFCLCKQAADPFETMLSCSKCNDEARRADKYTCPECLSKFGEVTSISTPKLTLKLKLGPRPAEPKLEIKHQAPLAHEESAYIEPGQELYCICRQPYQEGAFMISCDSCEEWFHGSCINLLEMDSPSLDKWYCPSCRFNKGLNVSWKEIPPSRQARRLSLASAARTLDAGMDFAAMLRSKTFLPMSKAVIVLEKGYDAENVIKQTRFKHPVFVLNHEGLGIDIPHNITLETVVDLLGPKHPIRVIDVPTQRTLDSPFELGDWLGYMKMPPNQRTRLMNVISLEVSKSPLLRYITPPAAAQNLDLLNLAWPSKSHDDKGYPQIQRYCLTGPEGAYTDFHVDLGGTSVWYHVVKGCKVFFMVPPSAQNMERFEEWNCSQAQNKRFFGDVATHCYKCTINKGNTMFIPSGWIHAVYTGKDSLVFGGNFIHGYSLDMHLNVYDLEARMDIERPFRYPSFERVHWLLGNLVARSPRDDYSSSLALEELPSLVAKLNDWHVKQDPTQACPPQLDVQAILSGLREKVAGMPIPSASVAVPNVSSTVVTSNQKLLREHHYDPPQESFADPTLGGHSSGLRLRIVSDSENHLVASTATPLSVVKEVQPAQHAIKLKLSAKPKRTSSSYEYDDDDWKPDATDVIVEPKPKKVKAAPQPVVAAKPQLKKKKEISDASKRQSRKKLLKKLKLR